MGLMTKLLALMDSLISSIKYCRAFIEVVHHQSKKANINKAEAGEVHSHFEKKHLILLVLVLN